jgi:hypothetical protein
MVGYGMPNNSSGNSNSSSFTGLQKHPSGGYGNAAGPPSAGGSGLLRQFGGWGGHAAGAAGGAGGTSTGAGTFGLGASAGGVR